MGAEQGHADAGVTPEQLLADDRQQQAGRVYEEAHGRLQAVEPGPGRFLNDRPRRLLALVPLVRGRPDDLGRELVHPVAKLLLVVVQLHAEGRPARLGAFGGHLRNHPGQLGCGQFRAGRGQLFRGADRGVTHGCSDVERSDRARLLASIHTCSAPAEGSPLFAWRPASPRPDLPITRPAQVAGPKADANHVQHQPLSVSIKGKRRWRRSMRSLPSFWSSRTRISTSSTPTFLPWSRTRPLGNSSAAFSARSTPSRGPAVSSRFTGWSSSPTWVKICSAGFGTARSSSPSSAPVRC